MNSRDKAEQLAKGISKSLYDLLEVLGDIDEDDPKIANNEWSITDDDGKVIMLEYTPNIKQLTITRDSLKLVVSKTKPEPKRKIRVVMKKQNQ